MAAKSNPKSDTQVTNSTEPVKPASAKKAAPTPHNEEPAEKIISESADSKTKAAKPAEKAEPKVAEKATKSAKAAPAADAPEHMAKTSVKAPTAETKPARKADKKEDTATPVVKTSAKSSVKYDPDFTHSVLDTSRPKDEPTTQVNRYSDSDLVEFRELIHRKLESAKKELAYLQGVITRKDETGGDNEARYMTMEDGSLSMEREQLSQMASRQITYIDHLEKALIRIESKTYGVCRVTGKLIDKARLRVVPHATLSVEAKMGKAK
jgi:RNA polymerase-binding transcription factor DksA